MSYLLVLMLFTFINLSYHIIILYFEYEKKVLTSIFHNQAFNIHSLISMALWSINGLMILALQFSDHPKFHNFPPLSIIGGIFFVIGVILGLLGYLTLGLVRSLHYNFFFKIDQKIVRKGIYKYLDNPEYEGLLLILLGYALYTDSLFNLIIFLEFLILIVPLKFIEDKPLKDLIHSEV